jgi:hypothetical protein
LSGKAAPAAMKCCAKKLMLFTLKSGSGHRQALPRHVVRWPRSMPAADRVASGSCMAGLLDDRERPAQAIAIDPRKIRCRIDSSRGDRALCIPICGRSDYGRRGGGTLQRKNLPVIMRTGSQIGLRLTPAWPAAQLSVVAERRIQWPEPHFGTAHSCHRSIR